MKATVYLNRITNYQATFALATDYFLRHNVKLDFTFKETNFAGLGYEVRHFPQGDRYILKPYMANIVPIDGDITAFCFNGEEFTPPMIPTGYTYVPLTQPFMDILLDTRTPEANYLCVIHELMHALSYLLENKGIHLSNTVTSTMDTYYKNNKPEDPDSNFGRTWALLAPYVKLLDNKPMYTYFSPAEVAKWKLTPELFALLDTARNLAGVPFQITSGLRTSAENAKVGGKPDSAHLKGLAVDLLCTDNLKRTAMLRGILAQPKPVFLEIAGQHLHIDIDAGIHALNQSIVSNDE